ncbi:hypothetical protein E3N88_23965 [Mikania micrantha]|uniref:Uncharacterized protein n=1 Tax=Mikania micrantha TaxID=192012 RepID=A0A5N6NEX9_9ASTR|nr:hypothetical protein E3N88_23965 [Mikania micrantha]
MIVFEKYETFGSKQLNWAYWAQPRPIAVRDGHPLGLSRYAKLERGNLNSPKGVAVRDDRSTSITTVRGMIREQKLIFYSPRYAEILFGRCRAILEDFEGLKLKRTPRTPHLILARDFTPFQPLLEPFQIYSSVISSIQGLVR